MGKKNAVSKAYMSEPAHFADAFNYLFDGRLVIRVNDLSVLDPTEINLHFADNKNSYAQKVRDIVKECILMEDEKHYYLVLGIENQSFVHYAMPVKNMIYDALNYGRQVAEKTKEHREKKELVGDEFLSGFSKADTLKPVITLVVYFGTDDWDGPRSLSEMFGETDKEVLKFVSDYKLNLIVPKEIEDFSKFKTEFGKVMRYISVADNREAYQKMANEADYDTLSIEAAQLLNECVGTKISVKEGEENVKICKAVQEIMEESEQKGKLEGERLGRIEGERVGRIEGERVGRIEGERMGRIEGERMGKLEGKIDILCEVISEGLYSIADAAKKMEMSEEEFVLLMRKTEKGDMKEAKER